MINVSKTYCGLAGHADELRYGRRAGLGPVVVYNCTGRCNLSCLHCYSSAAFTLGDGELSTVEAMKMLSQCTDIGSPAVLFSGGEPLLRADLFDLLAHANKTGIRTVLSTNGTLIDPDTAKRITDVGVSYVGISIDGREDFHDRFRKCKGAFNAAMKAFENCAGANLRTGLRFTITGANCSQIGDIFDIAVRNGIRRLCFYHLVRAGRASAIKEQVPSPGQTRGALDVILDKTSDLVTKALVDEVLMVGNHADGPYLLLRLQRQEDSRVEEARKLLVAAGGNRIGEGIIAIGPDGYVHPDQFWANYSLGNIREKGLAEIWNDTTEPVLNRLRNKRGFADARCRRCKWFDLCKGNYRFLGDNPADRNWLNEPACYLTNDETGT